MAVAVGREVLLALGLSTPVGDDVSLLAGAELVPLLVAVLMGTAVALALAAAVVSAFRRRVGAGAAVQS